MNEAFLALEKPPQRPADLRIMTPEVDSRLSDLGAKLTERFADPLKKLADDMADLDALRNAGRIDERVYGLAAGDLLKDVGGLDTPRLPDAAERGLQQLASMVAQATAGQGKNDVPALLKQIRQLLEDQKRISESIDKGVNEPQVEYQMVGQ